MSFDEIYEKIKKAVTLEIKYQYIDFDGKTSNFSKFMLKTLYSVLKNINKVEKQNIAHLINLFESYHIDSIGNRKYTIDKTLETFARLRKIIKPKEKKEELKEKKEFIEDSLDADVTFVKGVGPQIAKIFNKMGIFKVKDLIEYYPRKYIDYNLKTNIKSLKLGELVSIYGKIIKVGSYTTKSKLTIFTLLIKDSTGTIPINFFIKTTNRKLIEHYKSLYPLNSLVLVMGKVKFDDFLRKTTIEKAQIQLMGQFDESDDSKNKIVPIYSLIENLNAKTLANAINNALIKYQDKIFDPVLDDIKKDLSLLDKKQAIINIHKPKSNEEIEKARFRLVFEELFYFQLNLALLKKESLKTPSVKLGIKKGGLVDRYIKSLPFELTEGQKKALDEIIKDMNSISPMQRLLQGDVGSGKTVVACIALLCAIENGYQGAIMAPTEILANQHFKNFSKELIPLGLSIGLFTGKIISKTKN